MKPCLSVLLVALVVAVLSSTEYAVASNICPQENCLDGRVCDDVIEGALCPESADTCCSVVKNEHRTHCRHFGGECMEWCAQSLQQTVVDCPPSTVCCTLI